MGLFDWLLGTARRTVNARDMIWLTRAAKFKGLAETIGVAPGLAPDTVILVAHFPDTMEILQLIAEKWTGQASILAVMAGDLRERLLPLALDESRSIQIIVGERHPHLAKDQAIRDLVKGMSCRFDLVYHIAIDDPTMRPFAGSWVESTLRTLGMKEDEAIESPTVSRRLLAAQKRIAATSTGDVDAASAEEWMARNCPHFARK